MASTLSFITSNKGKPLLIRDNYIYYVGCIYKNSNHSHLQSPEEIEVRTFKQNIKRRVINETTAITKIYDDELARQPMSQTAAAIIPSSYEANSGLNRARRKMTPILPKSYVFDIPAQYQVTLGDE
ncbi:unnamed protein product, partial [Didymodactylos carnosus]